MLLATLVTFALFCMLTYFAINYPSYKKRKQFLKEIPSPKSLPIIGHALDIKSSVELIKKFEEWTKIYGKIIKLTVGPYLIYVTCDSGLLQYVLSSQILITKAHFYMFTQSWLGDGLVVSTGEKWRQRRKALTPTFHFKILEQFLPVFDKHARIFVNKLAKEANKSVELSKMLSLCTLDVICETAMGVNLNAQQEKDNEYVKAANFIANNAMSRVFSILGQNDFIYSLTPTYRKEKQALKIAHGFTLSVIKERRNELLRKKSVKDDATNKTDDTKFDLKNKVVFLDFLLQTTIDGKLKLTDQEIRDEVETFMFAGVDTTAMTISYVLYCLAKYPQIQQKVYEEITSIFDKGEDKINSYANLQNMKYTELVIKETLRLYPVVPYIGRKLTQEINYNGYTFLKGSTIILNIYGAHHNTDNFENSTEFKPERWDKEFDDNNNNAYSYIPFSAGPRNCIGYKFAMLEIKCLLSKIVKSFEFTLSNPNEELILANMATLKPVNGLNVIPKKRI